MPLAQPSSIYLHAQHPAILALSQADPKLGRLIQLLGDITLTPSFRPYESLVLSIISQQLSAKAALTIKNRVNALIPEIAPEHVLATDEEAIRQCGVSYPKIRYIRDLSAKVLSGDVALDQLEALDSAELLKQLTAVKGIGVWTAEMFLIFTLGRPDVLSIGDAGLQRAARWLHALPERADRNYLAVAAEAGAGWAPYRSYASLYLWRAIDTGLVDTGLPVEACEPPVREA
ncbi:DNA-3-methyladenine glycosylase family protein [Paenibacillus whitsoniae]|uniref:DNA-3-methyladenine glycosylase II n=1 Tax=Paenibacillus whitsoniae TaxID=2496558 RepID=A0A3S0BKM7_9BACL|nr:DNA-3-methyladenine glycosylase [Paenibacillus whitsoniae]RTE08691.1 DNA-3-methyladenine glycosylase 2 family protein [Paenibacillus whitsoniae]